MVFKSFSFEARNSEKILHYSEVPGIFGNHKMTLNFVSLLPLTRARSAPYAAGVPSRQSARDRRFRPQFRPQSALAGSPSKRLASRPTWPAATQPPAYCNAATPPKRRRCHRQGPAAPPGRMALPWPCARLASKPPRL